jgi:hypothetical protein
MQADREGLYPRRSRISAGDRSPIRIWAESPGTRLAAGTDCHRPSRRTRARVVSRPRSSASAWVARPLFDEADRRVDQQENRHDPGFSALVQQDLDQDRRLEHPRDRAPEFPQQDHDRMRPMLRNCVRAMLIETPLRLGACQSLGRLCWRYGFEGLLHASTAVFWFAPNREYLAATDLFTEATDLGQTYEGCGQKNLSSKPTEPGARPRGAAASRPRSENLDRGDIHACADDMCVGNWRVNCALPAVKFVDLLSPR